MSGIIKIDLDFLKHLETKFRKFKKSIKSIEELKNKW